MVKWWFNGGWVILHAYGVWLWLWVGTLDSLVSALPLMCKDEFKCIKRDKTVIYARQCVYSMQLLISDQTPSQCTDILPVYYGNFTITNLNWCKALHRVTGPVLCVLPLCLQWPRFVPPSVLVRAVAPACRLYRLEMECTYLVDRGKQTKYVSEIWIKEIRPVISLFFKIQETMADKVFLVYCKY